MDKNREKTFLAIMEHLSKDDDKIKELNDKFRKAIECPHKKGCKFFDLHSIAEQEGKFTDSIFGYVLKAQRCKYQFKHKRKSEFAPRGLDDGCKFDGVSAQ